MTGQEWQKLIQNRIDNIDDINETKKNIIDNLLDEINEIRKNIIELFEIVNRLDVDDAVKTIRKSMEKK